MSINTLPEIAYFNVFLYVFPSLMGFLPRYFQNLPRKPQEEKMYQLRQLLAV